MSVRRRTARAVKPGAACLEVGKKKEAASKGRIIKENMAMNQSHKPKRPRDTSAALTIINVTISRLRGLARRRFEAAEVNDQAVFESYWPRILTNFFYAETTRVSRALGCLSEDRNN